MGGARGRFLIVKRFTHLRYIFFFSLVAYNSYYLLSDQAAIRYIVGTTLAALYISRRGVVQVICIGWFRTLYGKYNYLSFYIVILPVDLLNQARCVLVIDNIFDECSII